MKGIIFANAKLKEVGAKMKRIDMTGLIEKYSEKYRKAGKKEKSRKNRDSILSRAKERFRRAAPKFLVPELGALFFVGCWFRINSIRPRSRSRMRVLRDYMERKNRRT